MANINTIRKFENEFLVNLKNKNKDSFNLEIKNINSVSKENYKGDLTDLIECSVNFYEDLIKVYSKDEKVIEIEKNSIVEIKGSGILYIIINKSCDLFLDYDNFNQNKDNNKNNIDINNSDFEAVFVKILVKENLNFNLITLNKGFNSKNVKIITKNNSNINHYQFNFDSFTSFSECKIEENSKYNLYGLNIIKNADFYNLNHSNHIENTSSSNMNINSVSLFKAKIYCDLKTYVKPKLNKIEGHQKSIGFVLGKDSEISCEPILEINSNDVICSHSASISKIPSEHLYYLNSRGFTTEDITEFYVSEKFYSLLNKIQNEEFKKLLIEKFENLN